MHGVGAIAGKVKFDKVKQLNVRKIYCRGIYVVCKSAGKVLHHKLLRLKVNVLKLRA